MPPALIEPAIAVTIILAALDNVWPMIADGRVRPIIGAELPIQEAQRAHELLASGEVSGKIVLTV